MTKCIGKDLIKRQNELNKEIDRYLNSYIRFANRVGNYINKSDSIYSDHPEIVEFYDFLKKELNLIGNDHLSNKDYPPKFVQDISTYKKRLEGHILLSKTEGGFINAEFVNKDNINAVLESPSIDVKLAAFPIPSEVVDGFGLT